MMRKVFATLVFAWTALLVGSAALAQDQVPVKIIADQMTYDQMNNIAIFTGNVHVDHTDFELWSDKLTVFMQVSPAGAAAQTSMEPNASRDIEKLLAEGQVRIKRDNQLGTSDKTTYWTKKRIIVMEGNPVLKDGEGSTISGEVITYHIQENRGVVQGGEKQRVQAVFMVPANSLGPQQ